MSLSRRTLLIAGPALFLRPPRAALAPEVKAFVDDYQTNLVANQTVDTNAAVRILSGMRTLWRTGTAWNTGVVLAPEVLRANVRFCEARTASRTEVEAARAFLVDRQHQSYSVLAGLGALAPVYKTGALAVTGITAAPAGIPATTIDDAVPADAPAGSAIGAGSTTSALGTVATLVNTVRGPFSSGNPSKYTYQYPRPWRMNDRSEVVDTGTLDALGYPVYDSKVAVVTQLLRQRSTIPAEDGGYPSGHTNALFLAALAYAYAVPERFQELITAAFDLADTRITAGMHSPVDVVSGRILATALAAAILSDPANAGLKAAARAQAAAYFEAHPGSPGDPDAYADRAANRKLVRPKLTYILPRSGRDVPLTVPKGAEVLLETRQPYLTAAQRRAVLRSTALPGGYPLIDGPEQWGRLDLFAAADGYGAFESVVDVTMDTADTWRNDISGPGGLSLRGTGTLGLTGANTFRGGVRVLGGTLVAGSRDALGHGDVLLGGGTLRVGGASAVRGSYRQAGGVLAATVRDDGRPVLAVAGPAEIGRGSTLELDVNGATGFVQVLGARRLTGRFQAITVRTPGHHVTPFYTRDGLSMLVRRG